MLCNLAEREKCYTALFPWEHANYGTDAHWASCYPYEQEVAPGETAALRVDITNHSSEPRSAIAQPILPTEWEIEIGPAETTIPPKRNGHIDFSIPIPAMQVEHSQRIVIPVDIIYDAQPLGQFREAIFCIPGRRRL